MNILCYVPYQTLFTVLGAYQFSQKGFIFHNHIRGLTATRRKVAHLSFFFWHYIPIAPTRQKPKMRLVCKVVAIPQRFIAFGRLHYLEEYHRCSRKAGNHYKQNSDYFPVHIHPEQTTIKKLIITNLVIRQFT